MSNLDEALKYLERGWTPIPLRPNSKIAAVKWKCYQQSRPSEQQVRKWWDGEGALKGIGLVLGGTTNLACRDFDDRQAYEWWATEHPHLIGLPTVETARGFHVYFIPNIPVTTIDYGDGELRGNGSYCVAPPSRVGGHEYRGEIPGRKDILVIDPRATGFMQTWHDDDEPVTRNASGIVCCAQEHDSSGVEALLNGTSSPRTVEDAILACLPKKYGKRNEKLFLLARMLKAIPHLKHQPVASLMPIVREWHRLARPHIRTKRFDVSWRQFEKNWETAYPIGASRQDIMLYAKNVDAPAFARKYPPRLRTFVTFCSLLQRVEGDNPFFFGQRGIAKLLAVHQVTVKRWCERLVSDDVLQVVEKGSYASMKSSRFRYKGGD